VTLKADELGDVAREIAGALVGRTLQKVVQPDERTIVLGFNRGWMLVAADAQLGRMQLLPDGKPPGTGEAAPPFCMLLRKELAGMQLARVDCPTGERACELGFAHGEDRRKLQLFLYGGSSRLQLVAPAEEGERILGAIGPGKRPLEMPPPRAEHSPSPSRFPRESPSAAIAAHFAEAAGEQQHAQAEAQRRQAQKKLQRLIAALRGDRARAVAAAARKEEADLLLAHLHEVPRGAPSVTLPDDFSDGRPRTITLDPALSAQQNVARLYKEHKRLTRALASIDKRLADAEARLQKLAAGDVVLPQPKPRGPSQKHRDQPTPPYRAYRSSTGALILVGRGSDRNDELTFKIAKGNDLWLHTRDVPGAHVVVPLSGKPIDEATLLDAATLAAHHSNARGESQVDVSYVLRKHVRKPPKSGPGLVTLSGAKTIRVRLEPTRLDRLLAARVDD
jgi:predicted ribosome quality control (RQC) complex YloA/Tae2 family protein